MTNSNTKTTKFVIVINSVDDRGEMSSDVGGVFDSKEEGLVGFKEYIMEIYGEDEDMDGESVFDDYYVDWVKGYFDDEGEDSNTVIELIEK